MHRIANRYLPPSPRAVHALLLSCAVLVVAACGKPPAPRPARPAAPVASAPPVEQPAQPGPGAISSDLLELKAHPDAMVLHARDPATLTESERKFGVAPRRDPAVEYQPDIILMEHGDQAIRAIASDGLTWTFDAHAPQVAAFAPGKIVFATGFAVGRVAALKRSGDDVQVILAPVQITDLIRNGSFAMAENVNFDNMLVHAAPDFPQPPAQGQPTAGRDGREAWVAAAVRGAVEGSLVPAGVILPGAPGTAIPDLPGDVQALAPPSKNVPVLEIQDVRVQPIASASGIGVQYYYNKGGVSVFAGSVVNLTGSGLNFFLKIQNARIINAGFALRAASSVRLVMDGRAMQDFKINFKKKLWVPVSFSIPLGGPVPFAINFDTGFDIGTGFSATTSTLRAEGDYGFSGGVWAGYYNQKWGAGIPGEVHATLDLGKTAEGVSVGITSLVMGADVRATAGLGLFGFTTGVFGNIRFAGTMLRSSDIGFAPRCRQGTIVANFDAGVGYSIPGWAADAINGFLSFVTDYRLDRVGAFLKQDPAVTLFQGRTQVPGGCASSSAALVPAAPAPGFPARVRAAPEPGNVRGHLGSRERGVA